MTIWKKFLGIAAVVSLPRKAWEMGEKPRSHPLKTGIVR